eukprot:2066555-Amphidinium_carterae.1
MFNLLGTTVAVLFFVVRKLLLILLVVGTVLSTWIGGQSTQSSCVWPEDVAAEALTDTCPDAKKE